MARRASSPKGRKRGYKTTKRKAHGTRSHWKYGYSYSQSSVSMSSASSESSEST